MSENRDEERKPACSRAKETSNQYESVPLCSNKVPESRGAAAGVLVGRSD